MLRYDNTRALVYLHMGIIYSEKMNSFEKALECFNACLRYGTLMSTLAHANGRFDAKTMLPAPSGHSLQAAPAEPEANVTTSDNASTQPA